MAANEAKEINTKINELESANLFKSIKSTFIFKKLLDYVYKKVSFRIIKYNKFLQQRLNLSLNDFEECSKLFSSIEIEIKPVKDLYGTFINIQKEEDKFYYHIFFNNDENEERRRYIRQGENIDKIKIKIGFQIKSFEKLFYNCVCIESINFKRFIRINITNMSNMFCGCLSLKDLNLSNFNTSNVISMDSMFSRCCSLKKLDLSSFKTDNVSDMVFMFSYCSSLEEIKLSNFNTNNVTDMSYMFNDCSSLEEIDVSNFIINEETQMDYMFSGCLYMLILKAKSQNKNIKCEAFLVE